MKAERVLRFVLPGGEVRDVPPAPIMLAVFEQITGRPRADAALEDSIHHFGAMRGDGMERIYRLSFDGVAIAITVQLDSIHDVHAFAISAPSEQMPAVVDALAKAATDSALVMLPDRTPSGT